MKIAVGKSVTTATSPYLRAFQVAAWLGIVGNLTFALPAIVAPDVLLHYLHLDAVADPIWLGDAGLLLTFLSLMYIGAARDPRRYRLNTNLMVIGRLAFVPYWLWPRGPDGSMTEYLALGLGDLTIGLIQLLLLLLVRRAHEMGEF